MLFAGAGDRYWFHFTVYGRAGAGAVSGPLRVTIAQGTTGRAGVASRCRERRGRVACR